MTQTKYYRMDLHHPHEVEEHEFVRAQFQHFTGGDGGHYTDPVTVPEIEALRKINEWNKTSHGYKYWL